MLKELNKEFEKEVFSKEFCSEYERIKDSFTVLESFDSPADLIQYLHDEDEKNFDSKDDILKALIEAYNTDGSSSTLGSLLILILWPSLINIFHSCKSHAPDAEDLWSDVQCGFLEAVRKYPTIRRECKIAANLKYLTLRHLIKTRDTEICQAKAQEEILEQAKKRLEESGGLDLSDPSAESTEGTIKRFHELVDEGILDGVDFHLIVETRIFRRKLYEVAPQLGLSYEAAKSRRLRAEESLRKRRGNIF